MNRADVLLLLDELLEVNPGTLIGNESIQEWDSIAIIGLIALADEHFDKRISVSQLQNVNTVDDVIKLLLSKYEK